VASIETQIASQGTALKAIDLYNNLEKDFITAEMSDNWAQDMDPRANFLCENFISRSMGLVCDFAENIERVYTAVFPSAKVMKEILLSSACDAMLFVHHPMIWDIRQAPAIFQQMDTDLLSEFKARRISIYNLHVPLDHFGEYSTSVTCARALNIDIGKPFAPYFGGLAGVFGTAPFETIDDLKATFEKLVGHPVRCYAYGDRQIRNGKVALVAGGGNSLNVLQEVASDNVNVFLTGITAKNDHSKEAHEFAEANGISILGGTHYSTEKFACIALKGYFQGMNLPCKFLEDTPIREDL